jgi:hypothetical protein
MSFFNLDIICMGCKEREKEHPLYAEARRAEEEALRSGDHHFPGIGCPPELYRPA